MKQKTKGFLLLFTKKELANVDKKAKKLGLNRTAYLRNVIKGLHAEACPTTELLPYLDEILEIKRITRNIEDKGYILRDENEFVKDFIQLKAGEQSYIIYKK